MARLKGAGLAIASDAMNEARIEQLPGRLDNSANTNPSAIEALQELYDGRRHLGSIGCSGKRFTALSVDGDIVGVFHTRADAAAAVRRARQAP